MIAKLVECTDYKTVYGILTVENVSVEEVQDKIYEIKNQILEENLEFWTISDVLENFPKEWNWNYQPLNDNALII